MQKKINNEHTKLQIRTWIENTIKTAQNPSPRAKVAKKRKEQAKKVARFYGL